MKFRSILYGNGKAGNIVGRKGKGGEYIISAYQPDVHNPSTEAQRIQRQKVAVIGSVAKYLTGWAKQMVRATGKLTYYGKFLQLNLPEAVTGTYPDLECDFTKMVVSWGDVDLPYSPSASAEGNSVTVTWSDNSGMGNAEATDKIAILVYNPAKHQCVYNTAITDRAERNATLALPTAWSGDTVNVWLCVNRPGKSGSMGSSYSTHLAALPL